MRIIKAGRAEQEKTQDEGLEMEAVNAFAKTQLQAQDVYLFSVLLCDNEVDRDYERFSESTLKELGELFTGATGICDHEWKSKNQLARIYRTELVSVPGKTTKSGAPYWFRASCSPPWKERLSFLLFPLPNGGQSAVWPKKSEKSFCPSAARSSRRANGY